MLFPFQQILYELDKLQHYNHINYLKEMIEENCNNSFG